MSIGIFNINDKSIQPLASNNITADDTITTLNEVNTQINKVKSDLDETIATIPSDYSTLSNDVSSLKEDLVKLTSDDYVTPNMIFSGVSKDELENFTDFTPTNNAYMSNEGTVSKLISNVFTTGFINLSSLPSMLRLYSDYSKLSSYSLIVGKKKSGEVTGWKYGALPSSFVTVKDEYVEADISYLLPVWESIAFNLVMDDFYIKYLKQVEFPKKALDWLIIPHRIIVDKNGCGDYMTIQEAVDNANNGDEIIVFEGEYEEAVDLGTKSLYLHGLNANNTIIWNDTGEYDTPPLEVGHGLIENITFYSKNNTNKDYSEITRKSYAVHLDQRWGNDSKSVVFKNCIFIGEHTTPIGCGVVDDVNIELYNCIVDATSLNNGNAFQIHGDGKGNGNANITISGCTFKKGNIGNGNGILLSNGGVAYNIGTTITIKANNCYGTFYNNIDDLFILDSSSFGNSDKGLNSTD